MVDHLTINLLRPERVTVIPTNSGLVFDRRPVLGSRPRWSRLREQRRALKHARAPSRPGTNGGALAESLGPASRTIASAFQSARPVLFMRTLSRPILTVPWPFHRTTRRTSTCERGRSDFAPDCVRNNRGFTIAVCLSPRDRCIPLRNNRGFTIAEQPWIYHYGALSRSYCHTADRVAGRCIPLARRHAARIWGGGQAIERFSFPTSHRVRGAIASPRGRLGHDRHMTSSPRARPAGHIVRLEGGQTRAPARFHAGSRSQVEESQWPRAAAYASSFARLDTRPSGALAPGTGVWFHNQGETRDGLNPLPLVSAARSRR